MLSNTELQSLEEQLEETNLSFEDKIEIKDKIIKLKQELEPNRKSSYDQISCIGCSG